MPPSSPQQLAGLALFRRCLRAAQRLREGDGTNVIGRPRAEQIAAIRTQWRKDRERGYIVYSDTSDSGNADTETETNVDSKVLASRQALQRERDRLRFLRMVGEGHSTSGGQQQQRNEEVEHHEEQHRQEQRQERERQAKRRPLSTRIVIRDGKAVEIDATVNVRARGEAGFKDQRIDVDQLKYHQKLLRRQHFLERPPEHKPYD